MGRPKRFEGDGGPPFKRRSKAVNFTFGAAQVSCRTNYCGKCSHLEDAYSHGRTGWCNLFDVSIWSGRYGETRATKCREAEQGTK